MISREIDSAETKAKIKEINNYFNNWLKERGFDCQCLFDTDFSFDYNNDVIYYAFAVPNSHDEMFLKLCQEIAPEIEQCDNFILSFFHELGHYVCQNNYTDEDWEEYDDILEEINSKEDFIEEDILNYYTCGIEISATCWACEYIVSHEEDISEWWNNTKNLIYEFMVLFGYEDDDFVKHLKDE